MSGVVKYVREYGNVSFQELPFNDADNLALCSSFYMPIEKVVPDEFEENPRSLGEVCRAMYAYNGYKHVALGLVLPKIISKHFLEMGNYSRFSELKVTGCRSVYSVKDEVQFAAATFIMPDGTLVVVFRGTDDTLIGWKEDLNILLTRGIPSHKLAHDYLEQVAERYEGNIIVTGHSKGGNIALYAALNCTQSTRDRILKVYNNDGPGFADYEPFNTREYREILPRYRHIVPHSSFVGMILAHDHDYTVVRSSRILGPVQHDCATWQIKGSSLVTQEELSILGKVCEMTLERLHENITSREIEALKIVLIGTFEATGLSCLLDIAKNAGASVKLVTKNWKDYDEKVKEDFIDVMKMFGRVIKGSYDSVKKGEKFLLPIGQRLEA